MVKSEFKVDGTIYCRGEAAYKYFAGDKVMILKELNEDTVEIVVLEGEGEGITMPTEKTLLK
jgi:hypothetical protein